MARCTVDTASNNGILVSPTATVTKYMHAHPPSAPELW
jgi:hypothetical protein